jgi:catechol 2,3-dioxygenase-like lactoylglutathione lyase family enzyme
MEYHFGRLIDHVHLVVSDLEVSKRFYRAVLRSLGRDLSGEGEGYFFADELFVTPGDNRSHVHLAFQADGEETVRRFHTAGLDAGGVDNGAPGERHYHPGYYAAFVLDPDGNNVEAVFHGPADRSTASVVVTPKRPPA